jgi:hypothetical protein
MDKIRYHTNPLPADLRLNPPGRSRRWAAHHRQLLEILASEDLHNLDFFNLPSNVPPYHR